MSATELDSAKGVVDVAAVGTGFAALLQWVPAVAGLLAAVYTALRTAGWLHDQRKKREFPFGKFGEEGKIAKPDKDEPGGD